MKYKAYPKSKDTPRRQTRKGERLIVYLYNRKLHKRPRNEPDKA